METFAFYLKFFKEYKKKPLIFISVFFCFMILFPYRKRYS